MKIRVSAALKARLTAWFASQSMLTFHIQTDSLDEANAIAAPAHAHAHAHDSKGGAAAAAGAAGRPLRLSSWQRFKRWFASLCVNTPAAPAATPPAAGKSAAGAVASSAAAARSQTDRNGGSSGGSAPLSAVGLAADGKCSGTAITVKAMELRPDAAAAQKFPRDVWVAVYRFLSVAEIATAAPACRLTHALSADRAVWRGVTDLRRLGNRPPPVSELPRVFDRLNHLTALSFASFMGTPRRRLLMNSDVVLSGIARACPNLQAANLFGFSVSDAAVHALAEHCPQLSDVFLSQSTVTDRGLRALVNSCRLKRLSLAHCRQLTDDGMRAVGDALALQQLSLSDTAMTDNAIRLGVVACHGLTTLYLSFTVVTDTGLRLLAALPALSTLQLQCCARITDMGVWDVANLCRTLTALDISGNPQLTDQAIVDFESTAVRRLTVSSTPNISATARTRVAQAGVAVLDDSEFCSELVEAEVAAEVYSKLELLAMADGYACVAEFVRVYMAAFLEQHQNPNRISAAPPPPSDGSSAPAAAAAAAAAAPSGLGTSPATAMPRAHSAPPLPTHHLTPTA